MDELLAPEKNAIKTRMKEIRELTGLGGPFWGSHGELARAMYESEEAVENVFKKYPILKEEIKLREALDSLHGNYSYPRLAGEIEARDTAARMGLSATQRQMTPPYSGQGIPLKDIITKMGVAAPVGAVLAEELAKRRGMERQWEGGGLEPAYGLEDIAAAAATGGSSLGAKSAAVAADIGINAAFEKVLDWLNSRSR